MYVNFGDDTPGEVGLGAGLAGEEGTGAFEGLPVPELEEAAWSFASLFRRIYRIVVSIPLRSKYVDCLLYPVCIVLWII